MKKSNRWVYFFPVLMDLSVSAVLLFSAIKAVEFGSSPVVVGILGSTWGVTYFFSSIILSRIIKKSNSWLFMLASCITFIFIAIFFNFCSTILFLFILLFLGGLFSAFFFVGFQLFMGDSTGLPHYKTAALYTLAWSSGMAIGSITEGFLMNAGIFYAQLPVFLSSLLVIPGILMARNGNTKNFSTMNKQLPVEKPADKIISIYARIAWIEIFTVTIVTTGIRYLLPKMTISFFNFNNAMAGFVVFLFFIFQAISGYFAYFFEKLRYHMISHHLMKLAGILSLVLPFIFKGNTGIFIFTVLLGVYSGHAFYTAVFYAINDESRSGFNVGINESLVGIASVAGPFLSGVMLNLGLKHFLIFPCFILILSAALESRVLRNFHNQTTG